MTDKERAFLDEIQAVCEKYSISIIKHQIDYKQIYSLYFESGDIDIEITDSLLEE